MARIGYLQMQFHLPENPSANIFKNTHHIAFVDHCLDLDLSD